MPPSRSRPHTALAARRALRRAIGHRPGARARLRAARSGRLGLALALTLPLATAACGAGGGEASPPNVLLITVDSLRADRLGCYGYGRDTTPNLDGFAHEAVRFERAYANAPFTAPSHASLFTSLHTVSHGLLAWEETLDPAARTFAERFRDAGWRTGAFYNHPGLRRSNVTRGFDEVWLRWFGPAEDTTAAFLEWVDAGEAGRPFAAWVHLWDVHRPYAYRDWRQAWMQEDDPELIVHRDELVYGERRFGDGDPAVGRTEGFYNLNPERRTKPKPTSQGKRLLAAADYRYISDRYDGGVAHADQELRRLFAGLRQRGLYDDTLLVVTADHGEGLTERDACYFTHDPFLYEETLRVPLLVRLPGGAHGGTTVSQVVRGIDVLPTMLEVADLAGEPADQGASLLPLVRGEETGDRLVFAQTQSKSAKERAAKLELRRGEADPEPREGVRILPAEDYARSWLEYREALVDGTNKLIHDVNADTWSLYDLAADPGETRDLAGDPAHRAELDALRAKLEDLRDGLPRSGQEWAPLDERGEQALEHAGYVGGDDD